MTPGEIEKYFFSTHNIFRDNFIGKVHRTSIQKKLILFNNSGRGKESFLVHIPFLQVNSFIAY